MSGYASPQSTQYYDENDERAHGPEVFVPRAIETPGGFESSWRKKPIQMTLVPRHPRSKEPAYASSFVRNV
jgi:hypothetical protein